MAEEMAAPIDRPLQKAYLKDFAGWSTAAPPSISKANTLRKMENVSITRDGGVAVRPGLRSVFIEDYFSPSPLVGGFENFFTNDGRKAILFAVRENSKVVFKAAVFDETTKRYTPQPLGALDFDVSPGLDFSNSTTYVRYLQIDNKILALSDQGESLRIFYVGENKRARVVSGVNYPRWEGQDMLQVVHPAGLWVQIGNKETIPPKQTATKDTLISSVAADNQYNYGYFYTFHNEIGETAASMIRIVKAQRGYSFWKMVTPDNSGMPTETVTSDARLAADQLVAYLPEDVYEAAKAEGATGWTLYGFTWSDQGAVPVEGHRIDERNFGADSTWDKDGWIAHTPMVSGSNEVMILPSLSSRENYSIPPKASQGMVAGDRVILTYDRANSARVYWSSALQGEYLNFSASKGGGYKTLTSGNLYVPSTVKLWQNPQSVDTLTILCMGTDGYSIAYYMNPNTEIQGGSLSLTVMGFEETTATPGTASPYGCEVLNNALYHPLDTEIMKSTASNYNISHASITEEIQNKWIKLSNKQNIISSAHDNRLYYIVDNPESGAVPAGCMGNEIWVCDTANTPVWSRWLVPGIALRKIEVHGSVYMAVVQPDGIYIFDELQPYDERRSNPSGVTLHQPIEWSFETNVQGANRAHDVWGRLQQINMLLGNFSGSIEYGVSGWNLHGKPVEVKKTLRDLNPVDYASNPLPFDIEDYLLIREDMRTWYFFAHSIEDDAGAVLPSYGQISLVQYRFTPTSVNVGYEYGSNQTFEYQRSLRNWADRTTDNGVPIPAIDTRRT